MRKIAVITSARSDYSYLLPVMRKVQESPDLHLLPIVTGMHLSPVYGMTVNMIEGDGFEIAEKVEMLLSADTSSAVAKSMGIGMIGLAQAFERLKPDVVVLLGDRFETLAAAAAALPFAIPVAHIAGGELTEGMIDEAARHAITKLSHLHFVSTEAHRRRVIQMGEAPWRVINCGAPSLDNITCIDFLDKETLQQELGFNLDPAPLLVTFHPVSLEFEQTSRQMDEFLGALDSCGMPVIFTYPNADVSNRVVIEAIQKYQLGHANARVYVNLGIRKYFSLMRFAAAMVGNSSSGIIEAASFQLPVVNIGNRQKGRFHDRNVIDSPCVKDDISAAVQQAVDPVFKAGLSDLKNPYGDGDASSLIVKILREIEVGRQLVTKSFYDLPEQR
ncbi:MAG: UDP-N-acetylglucosamine 2-epimerase [Anaerolineaceae bacterium]